MLDFKYFSGNSDNTDYIVTSLYGKSLLTIPQLNKGTAFSAQERHDFGLLGKLPPHIETLDEQADRAYRQFQAYGSDNLEKNIYLNNLHNKNEVLFYKLVSNHLEEMLPLLYTPNVGAAVQAFSRKYRQPRGLYVAYPDREHIDEILLNRTNPDIKLIVITDGEGVLGIGDQGIGGMDICIAKLMVYTLCGYIPPFQTLPIQLDVGTNNAQLLDDPFYLGWRHQRIAGAEYDRFVEQFVAALRRKFPQALIHWEDLGRNNAKRVLDKYREQMCAFNDDIQGTGVVTLAAILSSLKLTNVPLTEQRVVIYGAGSAGAGIADQILQAMRQAGLTEAAAKQRFWLIGRQGLLFDDMADLTTSQYYYARNRAEVQAWQHAGDSYLSLADTVANVRPTILIGCSAQPKAFSENIVREMARQVERPIILPLSNPTDYTEADPSDLIAWSEGRAIIATGSPFSPVKFKDKIFPIAQCNNALVFPGLGLGILAVQASRLTNAMLYAASAALAESTNINQAILPPLAEVSAVSKKVARAVALMAEHEGVAQRPAGEAGIAQRLNELAWTPHYCELRKKQG